MIAGNRSNTDTHTLYLLFVEPRPKNNGHAQPRAHMHTKSRHETTLPPLETWCPLGETWAPGIRVHLLDELLTLDTGSL